MKEFNDANLQEPRVSSLLALLARIDVECVRSVGSTSMLAAKQRAGRCYRALVTHTPRTQAFVQAHGTEARVQLGLACVALLLLLLVVRSTYPPSFFGELVTSRWVEVPVGVLLAVHANSLGGLVRSFITPTGSSSSIHSP